MIVKTQIKGSAITGLLVGTANVRRYFRLRPEAIDLELDHLCIRCDLHASFWGPHPEICDPRLCAWLQNKLLHEKRPSISLEMMGAGDCYRLSLPCPRQRRLRPD